MLPERAPTWLTPQVKLSLDVLNLFNRTYYTSSWAGLYVTPGAERSVAARIKVEL